MQVPGHPVVVQARPVDGRTVPAEPPRGMILCHLCYRREHRVRVKQRHASEPCGRDSAELALGPRPQLFTCRQTGSVPVCACECARVYALARGDSEAHGARFPTLPSPEALLSPVGTASIQDGRADQHWLMALG